MNETLDLLDCDTIALAVKMSKDKLIKYYKLYLLHTQLHSTGQWNIFWYLQPIKSINSSNSLAS